jgi:lipopolysaccharide transport system permease protein
MTEEQLDASVPLKVIVPPRGWLSINWAEIWHYRELLYFLTWRDVKIRYKQTVLGVLWAFIQPFVKLVIFSVIFGKLAKMGSEGFPYPVFLYAGLLPWQFFQEGLSRSSQSIVSGSNLVQKVYFPRLIIPMSSIGSCLVDFAIAFGILFGLMIYYGIPVTPATLMVIPLVVLTIITALGAGILFSAVNVAYRDFRYVVGFALQIWMYLTPVIYPVTFVPEKWRWLLALNPMTGIVDAYRSALLGKPFEWQYLGISLAVSAAVMLFGLYYFRKQEVRFADIV